ncbi:MULTISPECIES: hypothetical protein [Klebsiella]|uniref:Uncharacterized protein n=1 Tax=Klebsiella quasivariicola TaxID=2026240 RepID=A0A8B4TQ01_9ENTR|nr:MULTISPECIES: hypothetical protein [Klebsiella]MBF7818220.1 hypothetical protein [Klebsiella quasivariicola]MCJ1826667.1 hypothetical protein [Klebsiella quasivariicola]UDC41804.1 hypothetical protein LGM30_14085 [Klebsiella quasivariicola]SXD86436.1 Uncharacterised protein [Klebsiella quasivariicola]VAN40330.1 Uncharacterised protein [Klebsiella quasivariicola]
MFNYLVTQSDNTVESMLTGKYPKSQEGLQLGNGLSGGAGRGLSYLLGSAQDFTIIRHDHQQAPV